MRRCILIVDDEPYILRILSFKLRRAGYSTLEAVSAEQARDLLSEHTVDLMLLDVALATPTTGFELAEQLRQDPRTAGLPIVMLTARDLASDVLRGRQVGALGYVTKPFSIDEVLDRVQSILDPETGA
jgi:two-component system phosphate regulon response regulator PhoB